MGILPFIDRINVNTEELGDIGIERAHHGTEAFDLLYVLRSEISRAPAFGHAES